MKARSTLLLTGALLAVPAIAAAQAPATWFSTLGTTANMAECIRRAQASHQRAGSTNLLVGNDSVSGSLGTSRGVMVCMPDRDLVFIYTAGFDSAHARLFRNALRGGF